MYDANGLEPLKPTRSQQLTHHVHSGKLRITVAPNIPLKLLLLLLLPHTPCLLKESRIPGFPLCHYNLPSPNPGRRRLDREPGKSPRIVPGIVLGPVIECQPDANARS